jgi:hypothetical protein
MGVGDSPKLPRIYSPELSSARRVAFDAIIAEDSQELHCQVLTFASGRHRRIE